MNFNCYYYSDNPNEIGEVRMIRGFGEDVLTTSDQITDNLFQYENRIIGNNLWAGNSGQRLILEQPEYESVYRKHQDFLNSGKKQVFISHRQTDKKEALSLAKSLYNHNIPFWLDILDPKISLLNNYQNANIAIANIIEMALLNCSHVVAILSPRSRGSAWIPYEYGRVKSRDITKFNATALRTARLQHRVIPEYMLINGGVKSTHNEVINWVK